MALQGPFIPPHEAAQGGHLRTARATVAFSFGTQPGAGRDRAVPPKNI